MSRLNLCTIVIFAGLFFVLSLALDYAFFTVSIASARCPVGRYRDVSKNSERPSALSISTCRVTTGRNRDDGRRAILPVSACDTNASVRADI